MKSSFPKLKIWFQIVPAWLLLIRKAVLSGWSTTRHRNTLIGEGSFGFLMPRLMLLRCVLPTCPSKLLKRGSVQRMRNLRHDYSQTFFTITQHVIGVIMLGDA